MLVSPDGALNLIPMNALMDEGNRYLVERFAFTYLTSGRDLLRLQVGFQSKQGPVVFANPDFDAAGGAGRIDNRKADPNVSGRRSANLSDVAFRPLPGTEREAEALAKILPGAKVLTGAQASKPEMERVQGPIILHIATHGFFIANPEG